MNKNILNNNIREDSFKLRYPKEYIQITDFFPKDFSFSQKLYHYINNDFDLKLGICPLCGNRNKFLSKSKGYSMFCSKKCARKVTAKKVWKNMSAEQKSNIIERRVKTYKNLDQQKIQEKREQTKLKHFGNKNYNNPNSISDTIKNKSVKEKNEIKYKKQNSWKNKTEIERKDIFERAKITRAITNTNKYGVDNFAKSELRCEQDRNRIEKLYKKYISYDIKPTFGGVSKTELETYDILLSLFDKQDIISQYKSEKYPSGCDFYIKSLNLYIEINAHWTHGGHPFNRFNDKDIEKLNKWKSKNTKFYNNAIKTWTERDVNKRNIAEKNNLNFIEIFSNNISVIKEIIISAKDTIVNKLNS